MKRRAPTRLCLSCGRLCFGARCQPCRSAQYTGAPRKDLHADWAERKRRKAAVDAWRAANGEVCPGWRRERHGTGPHNPLTADHVLPPGRGHDPRGPLAILCRSCNGRKAATIEPEPRRDASRPW